MSNARIRPPVRPGHWCEDHGRWECTKQRSRGRGPCHAAAITGTDACPMHVGKTLERARADAVSAWAAVPGDDGIAPRAAVAAMLGLAWRRAGLLGDLLRQQAEAADDGAPGGLAELEAAERDRVVRYGKTAHDMGVQERRARLAAEAGEFLVEVSARALTALGADPHDPQVRAAVHEAIVATAAGRRWELIDGATAAGDD